MGSLLAEAVTQGGQTMKNNALTFLGSQLWKSILGTLQ